MQSNRDRMLWAILAVIGAVASQAASAGSCTDLLWPQRFANTVVQTASAIPADSSNGMPSHCQVNAVITPVPGSRITVVYRLPENWNGRLLGLGGAGWSGMLFLTPPARPMSGPGRMASVGLPRGYATAQTDGGHLDTSTVDVSWVRNNPVAVTDFSHRAIHEMTVVAKQVLAAYYGRPARKSYYQGCSTGGRMGMMETQRYPDDYDGVVAGAPVYTLLVQSSNVVRDQIFKAPGASIPPEQLEAVHAAVLAACDAADRLKDGVITDPRRCEWKPKSMQCGRGGASGHCLTASQVDALEKAYRTVRTTAGVVGNYALTRGSESGWNPAAVPTVPGPRNVFNGDLGDVIPLMFGEPGFDPATFDIEKQQAAIHRTPFAAEYEASSTDLSKFFGRGGKLILYHGFDDPGPSPFATIDYYERAVAANAGAGMRLFVLPGVYHCMDGPGADTFDTLEAMTQWVEEDKAPDSMVARNIHSGIERPACAWPKLPYFRGGDSKSASSFACR
jgi:feruloyl esterase